MIIFTVFRGTHDEWLKIDIATETISLVGFLFGGFEYNCGVVGEDCNVYSIPLYAEKVTKFNTTTKVLLQIGNSYNGGVEKWNKGVLHSNGYIYYAPHSNNKVLKIKTNHIRDEGNTLLESNASLTEFNKYINTYQFEYMCVTHKTLYDRLVSYRNNLIVETVKLALESFVSRKRTRQNI